MQPIIFLDIDGVLNPPYNPNRKSFDPDLPGKLANKLNEPKIAHLDSYLVDQIINGFDPQAVCYLEKLVKKVDAKIVLTSSWRLFYSLENIQLMFTLMNLKDACIDITEHGLTRPELIARWIKDHKVSQYLIIDDYDMKPFFGYHCIITNESINDRNYHEAIRAWIIQGAL